MVKSPFMKIQMTMGMKIKENELFEKLKSFFPDLVQSSQFDSWDCFTAKHNTVIELKCRNVHYDELIIERIKWDALAHKRASEALGTIYVCWTPKGTWAWNLGAINAPEWHIKRLPRTTEHLARDWINKEVGYLHIDQATRVKLPE